MENGLVLKLTDGKKAVVKQTDKKQCFFVGKHGQQTNAVFEKAYVISNVNWPEHVSASYEIGSRSFTDLSYSAGRNISRASGAYYLKKHSDGTDFLCLNFEYPAHDSYEKMYACRFQRVVYKENGEVVVIQTRYGSVVPKIYVYIGLKESVPYLDKLLGILDNAETFSSRKLSIFTRLLAQKYGLEEEAAEQMENFIIYTCLDAANISASFGVFKSRKKTLSYELIKAVVDFVCGTCFDDWYRLAPRRRYGKISDVIDYVRKLNKGRYSEWTGPERAFFHTVRKIIDYSVFTEVYAVSLILLKFLAENEIEDADSLKRVASSKGLFSSTLMADTVDGFSPAQLDGEAKKVFLSLVGEGNESVQTRVEKALYRYHTGSNILFRYVQSMKVKLGLSSKGEKAKISESRIESAVLCAAANSALSIRNELNGKRQKSDFNMQQVIGNICESICRDFNIKVSSNDDAEKKELVSKKLMKTGKLYLEKEELKAHSNTFNTPFDIVYEVIPENNFLTVYVVCFILLRAIELMSGEFKSVHSFMKSDSFENPDLIDNELLKALIVEARYRFAAMCGSDLLEILAELDGKI